MTTILSVSIPNELQTFLNDNPDLSPSKILQTKIMEIQENRKLFSQEVYKLEQNIQKLQTIIREQNEEIERLKGGQQ